MSNVFLIVSSIGATQCILFLLLLSIKKSRKLSDWILMLWFFVFFSHLIVGIYRSLNPTPIAEIFIMTIGFLHGPLFYVYTKTIFGQQLVQIDFLHFLTFVLFTIFGFFIPSNFELSWEIIILITKLISVSFYPIYILYRYRKRREQLKTERADMRILELSWIRVIAVLFLVSTGISIIRLSVELLVGVRYFEIWDLLRYIILVTVIGFYGLKYGVVYKAEELVPDAATADKRYKHSPLKDKEITLLQQTIDRFFKENNAYLKPEFSLAMLSKSTNIPKHHLSQIINLEMNTTFYDLVNSKRVAYAMARIREKDNLNLTLEGLGYECGFNSKSAFFSNFKKKTGKTPGQFKKEIGTD
ncbi:helix-turn-helix domain-containing protein [Spongiimicrobium salis]|uniref:helix-turn-helix domain-containing protein n=1 Tax=Spongiimicrobium salis TaxID=1667022 RepID=UPI00374D3068